MWGEKTRNSKQAKALIPVLRVSCCHGRKEGEERAPICWSSWGNEHRVEALGMRCQGQPGSQGQGEKGPSGLVRPWGPTLVCPRMPPCGSPLHSSTTTHVSTAATGTGGARP